MGLHEAFRHTDFITCTCHPQMATRDTKLTGSGGRGKVHPSKLLPQ